MRIIARLHSCRSPCGINLRQRFLISAVAVAAAAAAALGVISARWPPSCDKVGQRYWEYWSDVAAYLQINQYWLKGEGNSGPWRLHHPGRQHHHTPVEVLSPSP